MPTGDAYSSGHLVPSLWDLHMFYLLRPILFRTCRYLTGICSSNIPRYFLDFALYTCNICSHFHLLYVICSHNFLRYNIFHPTFSVYLFRLPCTIKYLFTLLPVQNTFQQSSSVHSYELVILPSSVKFCKSYFLLNSIPLPFLLLLIHCVPRATVREV